MKRNSKGNSRGRESGQVSFMVAAMLMTFILFFTFVINTGMLVNAKINLQNAADMAAYSGAAVQARQLTAISYLNYEMRRQFKRFLFRYYVIGNMAQKSHPLTAANATSFGIERKWSPDWPTPNPGPSPTVFGVPIVCVLVRPPPAGASNPNHSGDNYCQVPGIPGIPQPTTPVIDSTSQVLLDTMKTLELIKQKSCVSIGSTNAQILKLWLYNTDPTLSWLLNPANQVFTDDEKRLFKVIRALTTGLGIFPREFILSQRIHTLEFYVNRPAATGFTFANAQALAQNKPGDWAAHERTFDAFMSAYNTLGEHTFQDPNPNTGNAITLDELLPASPLLKLEPIDTTFDTYTGYTALGDQCSIANQNTAPTTDPTTCSVCPAVLPTATIPVGVYKDPAPMTYYAVRLKATAQTLFNPFGSDLTLSAYSAARPFGSRIGPALTADDFRRKAEYETYCQEKGVHCAGFVPNLPVFSADSVKLGWNQNRVIWGMFDQFKDPQTRQMLTSANFQAFKRGLHAAMAPNEWESGQYNIPIFDVPTPQEAQSGYVFNPSQIPIRLRDAYVQNFAPNGKMSIWAPIGSPEDFSGNDVPTMISAALKKAQLRAEQENPGLANSVFTPGFVEGMTRNLSNYIQSLHSARSGMTPDDTDDEEESYNIVRLLDTFNQLPAPGGQVTDPIVFSAPASNLMIQVNPSNGLTDIQKVKSSWADLRSYGSTAQGGVQSPMGRAGYSVKFIPLSSVASQPGVSDPDLQSDSAQLQH